MAFALLFALLFVALCTLVSPVLTVVLLKRYFERKQAELTAQVTDLARDFLAPPAEGQPSKFAIAIDSAGTIIGSAAAKSLMATMAQSNSAVANVANGITGQIEAERNPLKTLVSGGKRGRGAALTRLAEMLMPMLLSGRNGGSPTPSNHNGTGPFNL
jgi:hypothetical protein